MRPLGKLHKNDPLMKMLNVAILRFSKYSGENERNKNSSQSFPVAFTLFLVQITAEMMMKVGLFFNIINIISVYIQSFGHF